jgi:hypothetical protein
MRVVGSHSIPRHCGHSRSALRDEIVDAAIACPAIAASVNALSISATDIKKRNIVIQEPSGDVTKWRKTECNIPLHFLRYLHMFCTVHRIAT